MKAFIIFAAVLGALGASCSSQSSQDSAMRFFHLGDWEAPTGYSQSVAVGNRIYVSGTTGDDSTAKDMKTQMKQAYEAIRLTLASEHITLKNVVKETIYCTSIDELIALQDFRNTYYGGHLPAATWVQVQRLYSPGHLIEIEVEAVLPAK